MSTLRVGYLQLGRERSGLRRYADIIATEVATRPDVEIVISDVGDRGAPWADLRRAARRPVSYTHLRAHET